jgi:hypothetical protein
MATCLLDTSVILDAINNKRNRRQLLRDLLQVGNMLACCALNVAEIHAGMPPAEEQNTTAFLNSLDYHPIRLSRGPLGR